MPQTSVAVAQCALLLQDDFRLVPRPKGGNGNLRDVFVHTNLNDFWAVMPNSPAARWRTADGSGVSTWAFAASSLDPLEPEELPFPGSNGTAFAQGHAAATLPLTPPTAPVTLAADFIVAANPPDFAAMRFGFTASNATSDNFDMFGRLWLHVDGLGRYELHAGSQVAPLWTGTFNFGLYGSGWTSLTLTYDPATLQATGTVGDAIFGPLTVDLGGIVSFAGMESHNEGNWWCVANNFVVRTGLPDAIVAQPASQTVDAGGAVTLNVVHDADSAAYVWRRDSLPLSDGMDTSGTLIDGATTSTLTLHDIQPGSAGTYDVVVATYCGSVMSDPAVVSVTTVHPGDTNCDGHVTFADIDPFVVALGGPTAYHAAYPTCNIRNADADGNGVVNFADIDPFVMLLGR